MSLRRAPVTDTIICDLEVPNTNGVQAIALTAHATVENGSELSKQGRVDYFKAR